MSALDLALLHSCSPRAEQSCPTQPTAPISPLLKAASLTPTDAPAGPSAQSAPAIKKRQH